MKKKTGDPIFCFWLLFLSYLQSNMYRSYNLFTLVWLETKHKALLYV